MITALACLTNIVLLFLSSTWKYLKKIYYIANYLFNAYTGEFFFLGFC